MSTNEAENTIEDPAASQDDEIDQAVDGLRGVLEQDASGEINLDAQIENGNDTNDMAVPDLNTNAAEGDFDLAAFETDSVGDFDAGTTGDFNPEVTTDFGGDFGADTNSFGVDLGGAFENGPSGETANMGVILDIPVEIEVILGKSSMQVSSLMNLSEGSTIGLDRKIGEPVELVVNGRIIGQGEITVLEHDSTRFGIKLTEINNGKGS